MVNKGSSRLVGIFFCGICVGLTISFLIAYIQHPIETRPHISSRSTSEIVAQLLTESLVKKTRANYVKDNQPKQRKIFLDCGANVASTVELFRNTYPGGREYFIHSFEIDSRLAPYFNPYQNHELHCPVAVAAKNGNMTSFSEMTWSPARGKNHGKDMVWGGGTMFVSDKETKDEITGGGRLLSVRPIIPTVDLPRWIKNNTNKDDYVIFKLDVEGAEFDILTKMMEENTFQWIDKFYGEFHVWQPVPGWSKDQKNAMKARFIENGMLDWAAEKRKYEDFDRMHPVKVSEAEPGVAGTTYSSCGNRDTIALTVSIGMNVKRARKVVDILTAYSVNIPVMLFVHGDFAETYPDDVKRWAHRFDIGLREDGYFPPGHFEVMAKNWVRESLCSSELRLQELDIQPVFYLPVNSSSSTIAQEALTRGFRLIKPTATFPPREAGGTVRAFDEVDKISGCVLPYCAVGKSALKSIKLIVQSFLNDLARQKICSKRTTLQFKNYYRYRDVERVPKALRILDTQLVHNNGGVLTLDTDLPDTRMTLVFLLDYLVQTSGFKLVSVAECVLSYTSVNTLYKYTTM